MPGPFMAGIGALFIGLFALLIVWNLVWKALALWKAARSGSKIWFLILLVVNTFGILDILYIYVFSKKDRMKKILEPAKPIEEHKDQAKPMASEAEDKDATLT